MRRVALSLATVLGLWTTVEYLDFDRSSSSWLLLKVFHPGPWFYSIVVDVEVNGTPVHIDRTIECLPRFATGTGLTPTWFRSRFAVSERMRDGSGILVILPDICDTKEKASGFVPLIIYVDKVDDPRIMDAYFDIEKIKSGAYPIRIKNVEIEAPTDSRPQYYPNDFLDIYAYVSRSEPIPIGKVLSFKSLFLFQVPEALWRGNQKLAQELISSPSSTIPQSVKLDRQWYAGDSPFRLNGWVPNSETQTLDHIFGSQFSVDDIVPLEVSDEALKPRWNLKGMARYFRVDYLNTLWPPNKDPSSPLLKPWRDSYPIKLSPTTQPMAAPIWDKEGARILITETSSIAVILKQ
ncbi:hypothetical protein [Dongia sp.]|uniref:hypothetical protein n=1 Tax=Dongia sp. TaxID=1977262 RepID=UPI0035B09D22